MNKSGCHTEPPSISARTTAKTMEQRNLHNWGLWNTQVTLYSWLSLTIPLFIPTLYFLFYVCINEVPCDIIFEQ